MISFLSPPSDSSSENSSLCIPFLPTSFEVRIVAAVRLLFGALCSFQSPIKIILLFLYYLFNGIEVTNLSFFFIHLDSDKWTVLAFGYARTVPLFILWNLNLALTVQFGKKSLNPKSLKWNSTIASLVILGFGLHLSYQAILRIKDLI